MHEGVCGGHYSSKTTAHKILRAGYYWLKVFNDSFIHVRKCEACQNFSGNLMYQGALPLRPLQADAPFQQWGIYFIGEIQEKSSGGHRWILVATDYFTKWVEAIPTRQDTSNVVTNFLMDNIITRFGTPVRIITDNGMCFRSNEFKSFCDRFGITISYATPYHPQANGQAESSNKSLLKIIKRMLENNKKAWNLKLKLAVWADRIIVKKAIKKSPFELVYGAQARMPLQNLLPVYKFIL